MSSRRGQDLPKFVEPMLAVNGLVPDDARWAVEVKFDGMRAQVRWAEGHRCMPVAPPGGDPCAGSNLERVASATLN